jgi:hypothetical protein
MKIVNIEMTRERIIALIALGAVVLAVAVYLVVYAPLVGELRRKGAECHAAERAVLDARAVIESAGRISGTRTLMTEKDISLGIDELAKHGKRMGVTFIHISPKEIVPEPDTPYKVLPIEMEVEAPAEKLFAFIGSLDNFQNALVKVRSLNIAHVYHDKERLNAKIIVALYLSGEK